MKTETTMQGKRIPKPNSETALEREVRVWLNSQGADYDNGWRGALKDLQHGGCESGMVSELIYHRDTLKFYKRHKREIQALIQQQLSETGFKCPAELFRQKWDVEDPFAEETQNQNLLAWFGFEETANQIGAAHGYR
jgi:hypothetical protein